MTGYLCRIRMTRGTAACPERHAIPMNELHDAVVLGLEQVLSPERLDAVLQGLADDWVRQGDAHAVQRAGLTADLGVVENELRHLAAAVASGAVVSTLVDAIKEREGRRRELRARLDALDAEGTIVRRDRATHLAALRSICRDWRTLLHADPAHGRRVLRDLRIERVLVQRDDQGRWNFRLVGAIDKLIGEKFFAVTDEALAVWTDEPDVPADGVEPGDPVGPAMVPPGGFAGLWNAQIRGVARRRAA